MNQTKNDPAATAIAPGLGSTQSGEDLKMNNTTLTIERGDNAMKIAQDAALVKAFYDLEDDIHCLKHMSNIAASMVNDVLFGHSIEAGKGAVALTVTEDQRERFSFAVYNVASRASALCERAMAAYEQEARS